jgi:hypothetical protein
MFEGGLNAKRFGEGVKKHFRLEFRPAANAYTTITILRRRRLQQGVVIICEKVRLGWKVYREIGKELEHSE